MLSYWIRIKNINAGYVLVHLCSVLLLYLAPAEVFSIGELLIEQSSDEFKQ
jgi:hypothetical protein